MFETDETLTDTEGVAKLAVVSPRTVQNWVAQKKLPVIRISPRCVRFNKPDVMRALERFAPRTTGSLLFTHVPSNPMLATMRAVGRLFPHGDRAPDVEPVADALLRRRITQADALHAWHFGRDERVSSGFYKSHAQELIAP